MPFVGLGIGIVAVAGYFGVADPWLGDIDRSDRSADTSTENSLRRKPVTSAGGSVEMLPSGTASTRSAPAQLVMRHQGDHSRGPIRDLVWADGAIDRLLVRFDDLIVGLPIDDQGNSLRWVEESQLELSISTPLAASTGELVRGLEFSAETDEILMADRAGRLFRYGLDSHRLTLAPAVGSKFRSLRRVPRPDLWLATTGRWIVLLDSTCTREIGRVRTAETLLDCRLSDNGRWLVAILANRLPIELYEVTATGLIRRPLHALPAIDVGECVGFEPGSEALILAYGRTLERLELTSLTGPSTDSRSTVVLRSEGASANEIPLRSDLCATKPWIAYVLPSGTIEVWDYRERRTIASRTGWLHEVQHLRFDPQGNRIAVVAPATRVSIVQIELRPGQ